MARSTRRLGRGLDGLVSKLVEPGASSNTLSDERSFVLNSNTDDVVKSPGQVRIGQPAMVPIDDLTPNPLQPRSNISDVSVVSLVESIRRSGVLQPITVRRQAGRLEIIAGERRWTAARLAGLKTVPVIEREADEEQMLELALIENIQREDLNAMDRARAYRSFCDRFHLGAEEVGQRVGEDRSTVTNYLRLLELSPEIQDLVAEEKLTMGHARCLLGVENVARRARLAEAAASHELSVRAVEEIVRREKKRLTNTDVVARGEVSRDRHLSEMERCFERVLKTRVRIQTGRRKGSGRITIEFYSLEDFDRVAEICGVETEI